MRRLLAALSLFGLAACGDEPSVPSGAEPRDRESSQALAAPRSSEPGCALAHGPVPHEGRAPALAAGAVIVHREGGAFLLRLDTPDAAPRALGSIRVPPRGLVRREDGWLLAVAQTAGGPAALWWNADGEPSGRAPLVRPAARGDEAPDDGAGGEGAGDEGAGGEGAGADAAPVNGALVDGALVDGALAVAGDRAWAAWRDTEGRLWLSVIDRLERRVEVTHDLGEAPDGSPLAAATRRRGYVSVAAPDAPLWTIPADGEPQRMAAPGIPRDLFADAQGMAVLHGAADRTGAWLTRPDGDELRITHPRAQPEATVAAALSSGAIIVYRSRGDLWAQRVAPDGTSGEPVVVGRATGQPRVATRGNQMWVAWDDGERTLVRAGICLSVE